MHKVARDELWLVIVEHVFRALTEINAEGHAVRRPARFVELRAVTGGDEQNEQTLREILDDFRADGVSFLSPYGDAKIEPDTLIDISHEALIRSWYKIGDAKDGWLHREFKDGLIWRSLLVQAESFRHEPKSVLSAARTEEASRWLEAIPSPDRCKRYGGGWSDVQQLMHASRAARDEESRRRQDQEQAQRREAEERARRAEDARQAADALAAKEKELRAAQARRTQLAVAAAVVGCFLAVVATIAFAYAFQQKRLAHGALIETKATAFWSRLQLWDDPIRTEDVVTLWELARENASVRVAFVRRLADSHDLLARFGFKPQPIMRAVGLQWPDEAREIAERSVARITSDQFNPSTAKPFELVSYTRALAALEQWLDPVISN